MMYFKHLRQQLSEVFVLWNRPQNQFCGIVSFVNEKQMPIVMDWDK